MTDNISIKVRHNPHGAYAFSNYDLGKIKIFKEFETHPPKQSKIDKAKDFYELHGEFNKPIIVSENGYLLDGYSRYLVAVEKKLKTIPAVLAIQYVKGKIAGDSLHKTYEWKVPYDKNYPENFFKKIGENLMAEVDRNGQIGVITMNVTSVLFDTDATKPFHRKNVVNIKRYLAYKDKQDRQNVFKKAFGFLRKKLA